VADLGLGDDLEVDDLEVKDEMVVRMVEEKAEEKAEETEAETEE
jgi:hypothetical protein